MPMTEDVEEPSSQVGPEVVSPPLSALAPRSRPRFPSGQLGAVPGPPPPLAVVQAWPPPARSHPPQARLPHLVHWSPRGYPLAPRAPPARCYPLPDQWGYLPRVHPARCYPQPVWSTVWDQVAGASVSEGPPLKKPPQAASIFHNSYFTSKYYRYNEPQTDQ